MTPAIGLTLANRYELRSHLASGGMAQVWRAQDLVLDRQVAVKILHGHMAIDEGFVVRFRREAVAAAGLSHPSIVAVYDTVSTPGLQAIVMELIEGRTLRTVLDGLKVLPPAAVVNIGVQIAAALSEAHRTGIVHRDIKPANIILSNDERVLITDFGIAKASTDADLTSDGTMLGTAKYLSPEQVSGEEVDARADIYSLGVVLFEALAGRPPFMAESDAATALARLQGDIPRCRTFRTEIPQALDDVIAVAMAREPDQRYPRAIGFKAALSAVNLSGGANPSDWAPATPFAPTGPTPAGPTPTVPASVQPQTEATPTLPANPQPIPDHTSVMDAGTAGALSGRVAHDPTTRTGRDRRSRGRIGGRRRADDATQAPPAVPTRPPQPVPQPITKPSRSAWWLVSSLVAVAAVIALLLFANGLRGDETVEDQAEDFNSAAGYPLISATAIDPMGDGRERADLSPRAIDDDVTTQWQTESYKRAGLGGLKDGVGLVVSLKEVQRLTRVTLLTDNAGWNAEIYLLNADVDLGNLQTGNLFDPSEIGVLAGEVADGGVEELVSLQGAGAELASDRLLIWITETGVTPDEALGTALRFELYEVTIS